MRWSLLIAITVGMMTLPARSQIVPSDPLSASSQSSSPAHVHGNGARIEGSQHPELIPDLTAYRLFLVVASHPAAATAEHSSVQQAHQRKLGFSVQDAQTFRILSQSFANAYADLINRYNATAKDLFTTSATSPDYSSFLSERDALVRATVDSLHRELTPDGSSQFDSTVRQEKRYMSVSSD